MITGMVTEEGDPEVTLAVAGRDWPATIDTGFNGDLQLPEDCRGSLSAKYRGRVTWLLANNQRIEEETYLARVAFDGEVVPAMVSFGSAREVLIGTHFLRKHRLTIDFVARTVLLERS
jgi:predicted aspartyl protease